MRFVSSTISLAAVSLLPLVSAAQGTPVGPPPRDVNDLLNRISDFIIDPIIFTLFTIAFVVFIWGLVQFVSNLSNEEARSTGQKHMIYGLIGMAIMISVNGIIGIIQATIRQLGG